MILKKTIPSPFETELILAHILKKSREHVLAHKSEITLNSPQKVRFKQLLARRQNHEPLAYILGHKEFYGLDFIVDKNTLIPRPETELLVEEVLKTFQDIKHKKQNITIFDIGTGSGNIIISIAKNIPHFWTSNVQMVGIDIFERALGIARQNAKMNKVDKKIKFLKSNLLEKIIEDTRYKILDTDIIITANLPYLDKDWKNLLISSESAGLKFEPKIALDGGNDGLDVYRNLSRQIKNILNESPPKDIILFCEIGHLQKSEMKKIFSFAKNLEFRKDLAGKWRIAIIKI